MGNLPATLTKRIATSSSQASATATSVHAPSSPIQSPHRESQSLLSDSQSLLSDSQPLLSDSQPFSTWQPEKSQEQVAQEAKSDRQEKEREIRKYLLMQIEEYPALWRQSHKWYKEKTAQRSAWEEILTRMKIVFDDKLMEHKLSTVPDLMGAFSSLKAGLTQAIKSSRRTTGMSSSDVQPIKWPYYHECEFLRQVSEPLSTESSVDFELAEESSPSSGLKWDPEAEKQKRAFKRKETQEKKEKEAEERRSKTDEAVMETLSAARENLASQKKKKKEERKRKHEDSDEIDAFFSYMGNKCRQVFMIFSSTSGFFYFTK